MIYNSKGTISAMSDVRGGTSASGYQWQNMELILETPGYNGSTYKQVFRVSGDKVDEVLKYKVGDRVQVGFSLYAREWNDKLYNNVDLINIEPSGATRQMEDAKPVAAAQAQDGKDDDLPF